MIFKIEQLGGGTWYVELQANDRSVEVGTGHSESPRRQSVINLTPWEARALAGGLEALADAIETKSSQAE